MIKKVLKVVWCFSKWYLRLTVLYWAFIGAAEAFLYARKYGIILNFMKKHGMKTPRRKITFIISQMIFDRALWKWKFGLGLTNEEPGEISEPEKSEEETKEPEA